MLHGLGEELRSWGHQGGDGGHVILTCDGENAIKAVRDELARRQGGKVALEKPAPNESQSNGMTEEAGTTVRESSPRCFEVRWEKGIGEDLGGEDCITYGMVRWAAMLVLRKMVGKGGTTANGRRRGRRCKQPLACFGELVWYKKTEKGKHSNKMAARWEQGVWLGHTRFK